MKMNALAPLLLALAGSTLVSCNSGDSSGGLVGTAAASTCKQGQRCLPDVSYIDTVGTAYTPKSLAGKVVVVNFWATWCKPCLVEIPDLSKVYEKYKDQGVVFLGVLTNDNPDNGTLLNFQSDNDMSFPVVRYTSDILAAYEYPASLPTTFIFDRSGRQVENHTGALRAAKLEAMLAPLVKQPAPAGI